MGTLHGTVHGVLYLVLPYTIVFAAFSEKVRAFTLSTDQDISVSDPNTTKLVPFALPSVTDYKLCSAFADFDLAKYNPEEDKL